MRLQHCCRPSAPAPPCPPSTSAAAAAHSRCLLARSSAGLFFSIGPRQWIGCCAPPAPSAAYALLTKQFSTLCGPPRIQTECRRKDHRARPRPSCPPPRRPAPATAAGAYSCCLSIGLDAKSTTIVRPSTFCAGRKRGLFGLRMQTRNTALGRRRARAGRAEPRVSAASEQGPPRPSQASPLAGGGARQPRWDWVAGGGRLREPDAPPR